MGREAEILERLVSDAALAAILTGGIYGYEATRRLGITRQSTPDAFDAEGFLLPCALVKMRGPVANSNLADLAEQVIASRQVAEIWLLEDQFYTAIEAADIEIFRLLHGYKLPHAWQMAWAFTTAPLTDEGSLKGASTKRCDYSFMQLKQVRKVESNLDFASSHNSGWLAVI